MTTQTKIILALVALAIVFASGRYSVDQPEIKTKETIKSETAEKTDTDVRTKIITVYTKMPDGTEKTITTATDDSTINQVSDTNVDTTIVQDVIPAKKPTLAISALVGIDPIIPKMVYGASISKEVLGPVSIGAWGLTSGTFGISVGVSF